jgi:hypothetical protein
MRGLGDDWRALRQSSKSKKKLLPCWVFRWRRQASTTSMMDAVVALAPTPGLTAAACAVMNLSRASVYRQRARLARPAAVRRPRPSPQRALAVVERQTVLDLLRTSRFADQAPAEVYASLLDEGAYHCSIRTMHRILAANHEVRERRDHLRHLIYKKPELLAQAPNEGLVLGHHQADGAGEMGVLLPLRHRHFRRLVHRRQRKRHPVHRAVR